MFSTETILQLTCLNHYATVWWGFYQKIKIYNWQSFSESLFSVGILFSSPFKSFLLVLEEDIVWIKMAFWKFGKISFPWKLRAWKRKISAQIVAWYWGVQHIYGSIRHKAVTFTFVFLKKLWSINWILFFFNFIFLKEKLNVVDSFNC